LESNNPSLYETQGGSNPRLLERLQERDEPSIEEREQVLDILAGAFAASLQPNDEPTTRGVAIDDALGAFLMCWPIDRSDHSQG
jgi:hypothetical protein